MENKTKFKVGDEVKLENGRWSIIEEVNEDGTFIVVDEDGQDYAVNYNQIEMVLY